MSETEIDERLLSLSDTSIMLNFSAVLTAIYPHMKHVYAHCWDPYDEVVEPLYHALVYCTFAGKYGVCVPAKECQTYESVSCDYQKKIHVRVYPKSTPLSAHGDQGPFSITAEFLASHYFLFHGFGDSIHHLTGGEVADDPYDVTFNLTAVQVHDPSALERSAEPVLLWVPNELVEYEFVCPERKLREAT